MPSCSTSNMHIAFFPASNGTLASNLKPLPQKDFNKLVKATDDALERGNTTDVTLVATFCSDVFFEDSDFNSLVEHIEDSEECKRITSIMPDNIAVLTNEGYVVNIRLIGAKKHVQSAGGAADDSFESVDSLTQKIKTATDLSRGSHPFATPRK